MLKFELTKERADQTRVVIVPSVHQSLVGVVVASRSEQRYLQLVHQYLLRWLLN